MVFNKNHFFKIGMWHSRSPRDPPPFLANAILNFHFDYLNPSLTPSVGVLSVAPALLKACVYNSFLSSKASSFDHTWFLSGCNEPQHLKEENRTIKKGPWQVEAQNVSL